MIGFLKGRLHAASPEMVVLDVHGVGYLVRIPLSTYYEVERASGDELALHIHTHVREDAIELYGFSTLREQQLFERLIAVSGIGPRLARVILSGMAPDDLLAALADGDTVRLATIPGIGKKTAERMVLELRDRMQELAAELPQRATVTADEDLVVALVNLGYKEKASRRAVAETQEEHPELAVPELLRLALQRLSRI